MKHDKALLQRRFSRNLRTYDTLATVQRDIARRLATLLERTDTAAVRNGVEIGAGTGFLTRHLVRLFPAAEWTVNDLVPKSRDYLPASISFIPGDGEAFPFGHKHYDLIASTSTVQWFDDLPRFIARAAEGLASEGIMALSTFGPENFREITSTTGQGLEYYPLPQLSDILTASGLQIITREEWTEQQRYPSPTDVLRHLRLTGVNAVAAERWTHSRLRRFEADYRAAYGNTSENSGEYVTLTFHPIIIIARKH